MNLAIAKFFDTVHQKNSSRLLAETCNGALIEPEEIGRFPFTFLLWRTGKIILFMKRKKDDIVSPAAYCPLYQKVSRHSLEECSRVRETMPLFDRNRAGV